MDAKTIKSMPSFIYKFVEQEMFNEADFQYLVWNPNADIMSGYLPSIKNFQPPSPPRVREGCRRRDEIEWE